MTRSPSKSKKRRYEKRLEMQNHFYKAENKGRRSDKKSPENM
jgi:ribosomal protein L32